MSSTRRHLSFLSTWIRDIIIQSIALQNSLWYCWWLFREQHQGGMLLPFSGTAIMGIECARFFTIFFLLSFASLQQTTTVAKKCLQKEHQRGRLSSSLLNSPILILINFFIIYNVIHLKSYSRWYFDGARRLTVRSCHLSLYLLMLLSLFSTFTVQPLWSILFSLSYRIGISNQQPDLPNQGWQQFLRRIVLDDNNVILW